jgi:hypothetical protein
MDSREIAESLLDMALDMDFMDYSDNIDEELDIVSNEISKLENTALFSLLENIAENNKNNLNLINQITKGE